VDSYPTVVNEQSFDREVLQHSRPVIVAFSSRTCPACAALDSEFARAAASHRGGVKFAKVLLQDAAPLFDQYRITATPTLLLYRGGVEVARQLGALSAPQLLAWLTQHALRTAA
jgi:thioredoxin 2